MKCNIMNFFHKYESFSSSKYAQLSSSTFYHSNGSSLVPLLKKCGIQESYQKVISAASSLAKISFPMEKLFPPLKKIVVCGSSV